MHKFARVFTGALRDLRRRSSPVGERYGLNFYWGRRKCARVPPKFVSARAVLAWVISCSWIVCMLSCSWFVPGNGSVVCACLLRCVVFLFLFCLCCLSFPVLFVLFSLLVLFVRYAWVHVLVCLFVVICSPLFSLPFFYSVPSFLPFSCSSLFSSRPSPVSPFVLFPYFISRSHFVSLLCFVLRSSFRSMSLSFPFSSCSSSSSSLFSFLSTPSRILPCAILPRSSFSLIFPPSLIPFMHLFAFLHSFLPFFLVSFFFLPPSSLPSSFFPFMHLPRFPSIILSFFPVSFFPCPSFLPPISHSSASPCLASSATLAELSKVMQV